MGIDAQEPVSALPTPNSLTLSIIYNFTEIILKRTLCYVPGHLICEFTVFFSRMFWVFQTSLRIYNLFAYFCIFLVFIIDTLFVRIIMICCIFKQMHVFMHIAHECLHHRAHH